jgi:hypothetical protein
VTTEDLLAACAHDGAKHDRLRDAYGRYRIRDIAFLYLVALIAIANSVAVVFSIAAADCGQGDSVVRNECLFLSSFAIAALATRIWFFRAYLQYPVIALWQQHDLYTGDIVLNVVYFLLGMGCFAVYIVMCYELFMQNYTGAIIATCVVCGLSVITAAWYKWIMMRNIRRAIDSYAAVPFATAV